MASASAARASISAWTVRATSSERGERFEQQLADGGVGGGAADGLAAWPGAGDGLAHALVVGDFGAAAGGSGRSSAGQQQR